MQKIPDRVSSNKTSAEKQVPLIHVLENSLEH